MNAIVQESLKSIEKYLNDERQAFYGMFQGKVPGATCRVMTPDRSYFVQYIVDENIERVYVEVFPQITVEKPYRQMVHAYVNEKTSTYKSGRVDIDDDNGELKIRVETSIADHAVSVKDIKDMEHLAVHVSDGLERRLDKMAHGVYFREDDPDLMSDNEKKMTKLKKKLEGSDASSKGSTDPFMELLRTISSMEDDDNDESDEEDYVADSDGLFSLQESIDFEDKTDTAMEGVDVVLESYGENKLYVIKCVKELLDVSLPEAKRMVESAPIAILRNISQDDAEKALDKLTAEGAKAVIR